MKRHSAVKHYFLILGARLVDVSPASFENPASFGQLDQGCHSQCLSAEHNHCQILSHLFCHVGLSMALILYNFTSKTPFYHTLSLGCRQRFYCFSGEETRNLV